MNDTNLPTLRFFSLLLMLPGLTGLIISAMISAHYLATMPRMPVPAEMRMTPRNVHGTVIYQTAEEDRKLDIIEYSSVVVFIGGLGMGLVYLRKWGLSSALEADDESFTAEES
jgi:hypothetical protein